MEREKEGHSVNRILPRTPLTCTHGFHLPHHRRLRHQS
jgi:hypothetical protein